MQERRIRLIELAIQGGATIENAVKVASDWEDWVGSDDGFLADPLRLGVPNPCNRAFGANLDDKSECHGEIPQEQPSQPDATGLNFLEAIELLTDGVVMKRASWGEGIGYLYSDGSHLRDEQGDPYYGNSIENFLATDWQIIAP